MQVSMDVEAIKKASDARVNARLQLRWLTGSRSANEITRMEGGYNMREQLRSQIESDVSGPSRFQQAQALAP